MNLHKTLSALSLIGLCMLAAPGASSASDRLYHFVGQPLILEQAKAYQVVFRLRPDVPRSSTHRALALGYLKSLPATVSGGGKQVPCFTVTYERSRVSLHRGLKYRFTLKDVNGDAASARITVTRATPGYSRLPAFEDPKVRPLCRHPKN